MDNKDKYTAPADEMQKKAETGQFVETPSESAFFRQMEKNLKKYVTDISAPYPLEILCENFHRLKRLFTTFKNPWPVNNRIIQKACAWYLAYAKPSEEEAGRLMETLHGFTMSAYYLAEGSALTNRMRKFFTTEEQGLRQLFEYEKARERKHKEYMERLSAEGVTYAMTIGKGEIYGVLYPQIEELYKVMGRFIEREKAPFECKVKSYDEYYISISKGISLYADRDEFHIDYSLGTFECSMYCMPAGQMQRVADTISGFLKVFGENGDRKVRWDIADYPKESQPDIVFEIKEDTKQPVFRTVPWISKLINKEEDKKTEIEYFIDVNEIHSPELSFSEFVAVYRKLGDFLQSQPKSTDPTSK